MSIGGNILDSMGQKDKRKASCNLHGGFFSPHFDILLVNIVFLQCYLSSTT